MKGGHSQRRRFSLVNCISYFFFRIYCTYVNFHWIFVFFSIVDEYSKRCASCNRQRAKRSHWARATTIATKRLMKCHWKNLQVDVEHHHPAAIGKADGVARYPPSQPSRHPVNHPPERILCHRQLRRPSNLITR